MKRGILKDLLEAGVVGAVCHIEYAGHVTGGGVLHLNKMSWYCADVGSASPPTCSNKDSKFLHFASQNSISVLGPGCFPSSSS